MAKRVLLRLVQAGLSSPDVRIADIAYDRKHTLGQGRQHRLSAAQPEASRHAPPHRHAEPPRARFPTRSLLNAPTSRPTPLHRWPPCARMAPMPPCWCRTARSATSRSALPPGTWRKRHCHRVDGRQRTSWSIAACRASCSPTFRLAMQPVAVRPGQPAPDAGTGPAHARERAQPQQHHGRVADLEWSEKTTAGKGLSNPPVFPRMSLAVAGEEI